MTRPRATVPARSPWFPYPAPDTVAEVRLFCLPPAGGGASGYRLWIARLAPRIGVLPVQLAGRESRFVEAPITSAGEAVERLAEVIDDETANGTPFALFGHSMGALLAFDLACTLGRPPAQLIVSAHVPAHLMAL